MKKTIIFDFDGVIVNSSNIKSDAFEKLFSPYGKSIGIRAKRFHIENEGIPRSQKFKYINKYIINSKKKDNLEKLNHKYSKIILSKISNKKLSYGFKKFIKTYNQDLNLYISSSAPLNELKYIINKKKINKFFKIISGFPPKKIVQIRKIIKDHKLSKQNIYYIGDTEHDYQMSKKLNLNFIGYIKYGNKFQNQQINLVKNFEQIFDYIN